MTVFFIGDTHLKANSPVSRKDNYSKAILDKLEYLSDIAFNYNCNTFIILGDVFDSPSTTIPYLSQVINTFNSIKEKGIKIYTLAGNHDLKNDRLDSLANTTLGILLSTNIIELAPPSLLIEDTLFKCYHYPETICDNVNRDIYSVCVAHRYYDYSFSEWGLYESDLIRYSYDAMILGHYHAPCDTIKVGETILYRPGSLARCSSETYNRYRIPRVLCFDCKNHNTTYIDVKCATSKDIFIEEINKEIRSLSMNELVNFIKSTYTSSDLNIREYFQSLDIPYDCKLYIESCFNKLGV